MKVTLIQPYYFNIWEAIGLGYIAAYSKKNYPGKLEIDFYQGYFDQDDEIVKTAKDSDIVGFSCTSPSYNHGVRLARKLKELNPGIRTVFGGNHVSALKELIHEESIDQMVIGEGEKAFLEILKGKKDRLVYGQPVPFEELPWPARDCIKNYRTVDLCQKMINKRIASFQANRVCPFQCKYCSEKVITGLFNRKTNPIRSRNVKDLLDEIETVTAALKLDYFKFVDATFDTSSEYVISFCEEKIRRKFDAQWECMIHAGIAEKKIFRWLKEANCSQINVGCESGSPRILRQMSKGVTVEKIIDVFDWAKEYAIERRAFFILGMPEEQQEDIRLTEQLAERIKADVLGVTILCPYPGSDLYDHASMKAIDWDKTDEYSNDFWHTKYFTNAELKRWQKYLTDKFKHNLAWHHTAMDAGHNSIR
jgi:radical SAM superfamily enzyme YgiQ (UPF0313 family)